MMKSQLRRMQAVAIGGLWGVVICLVIWQGHVEAASDCYLKCFVTGEGTRVCVVEGHRLHEKITIRVDSGDQCFSSIAQAKAAGFTVLGAPASKPAEEQSRPEVIPAAPTETPEPLPEDTPPDPTPETTQPEPEHAVETGVQDSPETAPEQAEDAVVEEAPAGGEMSPTEREKQVLIAKMMDDSLSMSDREHAYQQLINSPDLSEEERQGIELAWSFVGGGGMQALVMETLMALLLGPVGIGLLVLLLFFIICGWVLFSKADVPGWLSIIPIVNLFFMVKISGKPIWWFILLFVPIVGQIFWLLVCLGLAERFGKGAFMGIVLFFLPFIGLPVLAFTGEYQG